MAVPCTRPRPLVWQQLVRAREVRQLGNIPGKGKNAFPPDPLQQVATQLVLNWIRRRVGEELLARNGGINY